MVKLYKVAEVADLLRLSKSKAYELIGRGKLPHLKVGGSIRISDQDLIAFLGACRVEEGPIPTPRPTQNLKHLN